MRCPSPDLTTACATIKAITTSRTLGFAKPTNALEYEMVPLRTTAATASVVEVSKENALSRTAAIAATKIAKRCHAGEVSPSGTGDSQIPMAMAKGTMRFSAPGRVQIILCLPNLARPPVGQDELYR